jgi:hypothetical protein
MLEADILKSAGYPVATLEYRKAFRGYRKLLEKVESIFNLDGHLPPELRALRAKDAADADKRRNIIEKHCRLAAERERERKREAEVARAAAEEKARKEQERAEAARRRAEKRERREQRRRRQQQKQEQQEQQELALREAAAGGSEPEQSTFEGNQRTPATSGSAYEPPSPEEEQRRAVSSSLVADPTAQPSEKPAQASPVEETLQAKTSVEEQTLAHPEDGIRCEKDLDEEATRENKRILSQIAQGLHPSDIKGVKTKSEFLNG